MRKLTDFVGIEKRVTIGLCTVAATALMTCAQPALAGDDCELAPPGFWERDTALGSFGGKRFDLCKMGIQLGGTSTNEYLNNAYGGVSHGGKAQGRTELDLDLDLEKLVGLNGLTVHASAMLIYGGRMGKNLGSLMTASGIEGIPQSRLYTLWAQQMLFDDTVSLRLGQLAADDEFAVSKLSAVFVNSTFGWPFMISGNLPSGGPAFPIPTPGARAKVTLTDEISVMAAAFSGDPAGKFTPQDPQRRNNNGTTFSFDRGTLYMTEAAYAVNQEKNSKGLPGSYKLGAWYHSARFNDQHIDNLGQSLADGNSTGIGSPVRGNGGVYFVIDQMLIQGQRWSTEGIGVFLRGGAAPSDRNQVPYYVDGGISYTGLFEGREEDTLALGVGYARLSESLASLDRDTRIMNSQPGRPIRSSETVIELTYMAQVTPWMTIQPDLQYVVNPGGGIWYGTTPGTSRQELQQDAFIFGVRSAVKF
ncbi:carbohydrate porin [Paramagnetospirillum kuznetsovii]|uniref:Carbohydrate porin n=1 Tax=Paramagnetospirillum kuznetsovii TaxID=2053833 RepID=A0A364NTX3_9PROT|nr:carbohydrate porin [Paramagnetospirillum kuznetsovii]RAU20355.1 carbohydrate porin [Paramagnetospirillum kuznetsovii]